MYAVSEWDEKSHYIPFFSLQTHVFFVLFPLLLFYVLNNMSFALKSEVNIIFPCMRVCERDLATKWIIRAYKRDSLASDVYRWANNIIISHHHTLLLGLEASILIRLFCVYCICTLFFTKMKRKIKFIIMIIIIIDTASCG